MNRWMNEWMRGPVNILLGVYGQLYKYGKDKKLYFFVFDGLENLENTFIDGKQKASISNYVAYDFNIFPQ